MTAPDRSLQILGIDGAVDPGNVGLAAAERNDKSAWILANGQRPPPECVKLGVA